MGREGGVFPSPMISLENVMNTPWTDEQAKNWKKKKGQKCIRKNFSEIRDATIYLKMGTKNHYLPHTSRSGVVLQALNSFSRAGLTSSLSIACLAALGHKLQYNTGAT
jgi:hypothetical protein